MRHIELSSMLPGFVINVGYIALFWNCSDSKNKCRSNFVLFDPPVEIMRGMGEMSGEFEGRSIISDPGGLF